MITETVAVLATYKNNKDNIESNEKISREEQAAENKRNERQIDADIVWKPRVDWIQNVRKITAEFITNCHKYMRIDGEPSNEDLDLVEEKKLSLISHFGPDERGSDQEIATNILDKKTNSAKNGLIIALINDIFGQIIRYHHEQKLLDNCRKELAKCAECENGQTDKQYFCEINEYGDKFSEKECLNFQDKISKEVEESNTAIRRLSENLNKLSEAMKIYLKIEEDCVKNRDKC